MSLIQEFAKGVVNSTREHYTIDGVIVADDDTAFAVGYNAAESTYAVIEVKRDDAGDFQHEAIAWRYRTLGEAIEAAALSVIGHKQ